MSPRVAITGGARESIAVLLQAEPVETLRRIADQDRIRSIPVLDFDRWATGQQALRSELEASSVSAEDAGHRSNATIADLARAELEARP